MIDIHLRVGDHAYELTIQGHAGYDAGGHDIVCAGVSAIAYTLLGFLKSIEYDIGSTSAQVNSGGLHLMCQGGEKVETAIDMAMIGLQQIAAKYPKHVSVTIHPAPGG